MLSSLQHYFGERTACVLLGVPVLTYRRWISRGGLPSSGVRVVWLTWCLTLHPERLQSLFDMATWGRFRVERQEAPAGD
jgi:hypothetical protein